MATQNNFKVKTGLEIPSLDTFVTTDQTQIPSVLPSLNLDFTKKILDPRITFTRTDATTCATYTDSLGVIKTVPANVARFNHDPLTGECKGLLIEESRTNSATYSNTFSSWVIGGSPTITSGVAGSPDGTANAWTITDSNASGYQLINTANVSYTANDIWCASLYVKKDSTPKTSRFPLIRVEFSASANSIDISFDTSTGEFLPRANGVSAVITNSGCIDCGNWWRVWISGYYPTTVTTLNMTFYPAVGAGSVLTAYSSTAIGSATIWGAQLEKGAFPTSYIPTSGSTVTRARDDASITGTNFSSWYRQDEGTFVVDFNYGLKLASIRLLGFINGSDTNNYMEIVAAYNLVPQVTYGTYWYGANAGVIGAINANFGYIPLNVAYQRRKCASAYKVNDFSQSNNGGGVGTDTTATVPAADRMYFTTAGNASSGLLCGTYRSIQYYPKRLSNAELVALSSQ